MIIYSWRTITLKGRFNREIRQLCRAPKRTVLDRPSAKTCHVPQPHGSQIADRDLENPLDAGCDGPRLDSGLATCRQVAGDVHLHNKVLRNPGDL